MQNFILLGQETKNLRIPLTLADWSLYKYFTVRGSPPEPAPPDPRQPPYLPGLSKASTMPGPGSLSSLEELSCRTHSVLTLTFCPKFKGQIVIDDVVEFWKIPILDC